MRAVLPALLALVGCGHRLGVPHVTYGDPEPVPLVRMLADARWYVPMEVEGHGDWVWFLDTGYSYSTCDDGLIEALGVTSGGRTVVRGELGRLRTSKARLPSMRFGGHALDGLVCQVRDLNATSSIRDPADVRIAGVLGMDVLRPFLVTMDPADGLVLLQDPRHPTPLEPGDGTVRLRRERRVGIRALVPLDVGDRRVWPVLDTGASGTHLDGDQLGLVPSAVRDGVVVRGTGGSGTTTRTVAYYDLDEVRLGALDPGRVVVAGRTRGAGAGLLGLNVLGRYRATYDFRRRRAHFVPVLGRPLPTWAAWSEAGGEVPGSRLSLPEGERARAADLEQIDP